MNGPTSGDHTPLPVRTWVMFMPKEQLNPKTLFLSLPHGFSQIVVASGRKTAFISGQTAWDAQKRIVGGASLLEQARQALRNVQAAVDAVGERILFSRESAREHLDRSLGPGGSRFSDRD
jgi:enamine deaminase RidA (YjgF/YER057c/UK114 family)